MLEIVKMLEKYINIIKPEIIYTHHYNDINMDHNVLHKASLVALRPINQYIKQIYTYETISSTEWGYPLNFKPDTWVEISNELPIKLEAMKCYHPELREYPHPRSLKAIKNRALKNGNDMCLGAAEIFSTVRNIC